MTCRNYSGAMDLSFETTRALMWLSNNRQAAALPEDVVPRHEARGVYDELRDHELVADTLTMGQYT